VSRTTAIDPLRRRLTAFAGTFCALPLLVTQGCAHLGVGESGRPRRIDRAPAPMPPLLADFAAGRSDPDFVLLGEVHDHPLHHRLRLDWLEAIARRRRFVLAMEQLDADRQPDIDRARVEGLSARALAEAAGFQFRGWDWAYYGPFVELALRSGLPLVGANLSTAQARDIARGRPHPLSAAAPPGWSPEDARRQQEDIRDGHCGMLPESAVAPMSAAQRARDATIAQAIVDARRATGLPVVLLAGNGHVRGDIGVPRYLSGLMPQACFVTVGILEQPEDAAQATAHAQLDRDFDVLIETPRHARPDPCEALKARRRG